MKGEQRAQPGSSFQAPQQHLQVGSSRCKWQEALGPQMQSLALKGSAAVLSAPRFLAPFCSDPFLGSDNLPTRSALPPDSMPGCLWGGLGWFFPTPTLSCFAGGRYSRTSQRITSLSAPPSRVLLSCFKESPFYLDWFSRSSKRRQGIVCLKGEGECLFNEEKVSFSGLTLVRQSYLFGITSMRTISKSPDARANLRMIPLIAYKVKCMFLAVVALNRNVCVHGNCFITGFSFAAGQGSQCCVF